jgi:hypothetical protein
VTGEQARERDEETAIAYLRSPLAIRARCENILDASQATSRTSRSISRRFRRSSMKSSR